MDIRTFRYVQLMALKAVENPTYDDFFRRTQRWYSEKYHVPLNKMDEIPDQQVLQAWFEERLHELASSSDQEDQHRYKEMREQILNENQDEQVEAEDDAWEKEMIAQLEAQERAKALKKEEQDLNLKGDSGAVSGETSIPEN